MEKKKKERIIAALGITIIVLALCILCYSTIVVKNEKLMKNIKCGTLNMSYIGNNVAMVSPMKPMQDDDALESNNYFSFKLSSDNSTKQYIYFEPFKDNTLSKEFVKVSLSTYDGTKENVIVTPTMIGEFDSYEQDYGYLLYSDKISSDVEYRFRIWIDENANQEEVSRLKYKVYIKTNGAM